MRVFRVFLRQASRLLVTVAAVAVAGSAMARYAPGWGVDERDLDAHLSRASQQHIHSLHADGASFPAFLARSFTRIWHGDWGKSVTWNAPVRELIASRARTTVAELSYGLGFAALAAASLAGLSLRNESSEKKSLGTGALRASLSSVSGLLLCVPSAVLGYLALWFRLPVGAVLAATVFPHIFQYFSNLLAATRGNPSSVCAESRGLAAWRVHVFYAALPCVPEALAALGMGASIAFGASIPIEFITGVQGLGQLAWQSASSRDMPVLFAILLLAAAFILLVNCGADVLRSLVLPEVSDC